MKTFAKILSVLVFIFIAYLSGYIIFYPSGGEGWGALIAIVLIAIALVIWNLFSIALGLKKWLVRNAVAMAITLGLLFFTDIITNNIPLMEARYWLNHLWMNLFKLFSISSTFCFPIFILEIIYSLTLKRLVNKYK